jgi:DNA-binding NarL/FixJ family response regulator
MRRHHPQRVRVLIADDQAPSTARIKKMVAPNFEVVGTVHERGEQTLSQALALKPDVILINIAVVIEDCFETVKKIFEQLPLTRVIFHQYESGYRSCAANVSLDGASILGRRSRISLSECAFSDAIHLELKPKGHRTLVADQASGCASQTPEPSSRELTDREYEVLALLAAGHPMKRIAYRLGITYRTVTFHKYRMMERLGITTNAGLVGYALKRNISEHFGRKEATAAA